MWQEPVPLIGTGSFAILGKIVFVNVHEHAPKYFSVRGLDFSGQACYHEINKPILNQKEGVLQYEFS